MSQVLIGFEFVGPKIIDFSKFLPTINLWSFDFITNEAKNVLMSRARLLDPLCSVSFDQRS